MTINLPNLYLPHCKHSKPMINQEVFDFLSKFLTHLSGQVSCKSTCLGAKFIRHRPADGSYSLKLTIIGVRVWQKSKEYKYRSVYVGFYISCILLVILFHLTGRVFVSDIVIRIFGKFETVPVLTRTVAQVGFKWKYWLSRHIFMWFKVFCSRNSKYNRQTHWFASQNDTS